MFFCGPITFNAIKINQNDFYLVFSQIILAVMCKILFKSILKIKDKILFKSILKILR